MTRGERQSNLERHPLVDECNAVGISELARGKFAVYRRMYVGVVAEAGRDDYSTVRTVEAIPAGGSGGCGSCMTMQGAARGPRTSMPEWQAPPKKWSTD